MSGFSILLRELEWPIGSVAPPVKISKCISAIFVEMYRGYYYQHIILPNALWFFL